MEQTLSARELVREIYEKLGLQVGLQSDGTAYPPPGLTESELEQFYYAV